MSESDDDNDVGADSINSIISSDNFAGDEDMDGDSDVGKHNNGRFNNNRR